MKTLQFVSFYPISKIAMRRAQRFLAAFLFCGLAMLLFPMSARAGIALQDGPVGMTNSPTTSTNLSMPFTVSSGANVLVVTLLDKISTSGGVAPTILSWNGQTLTRAVNTFDTASIYREASIYYLFNPATDGLSHNITGSLKPTTVTVSLMQAFTLNGVDTNVPPVTGAANSTSGSSFLSFNVTIAAGSWAAVGGILGSTIPGGSAVSGTGGTTSVTTTNAAANTAFSFGYISGLSAGSDTISYSWTLPASPNPTANAFVAAVFAPPAPPAFVKQPESLSLYSGGMVQFSAIVAGATSYQWLSNSVPLAGATNTTLAYGPGAANVVAGANYSLVASSANGSVTSSVVTVSIRIPVEPYETAVASLGPYVFYQLNETADPATTVGGATAFDNANSLNGLYGVDAQNAFNGIAGPTPPAGFPGFTSTNAAVQTINNDVSSTVTLPPLNLDTNTVTFTTWINPTIHEGPNVALLFCRGINSGVIAGFNYSPNFNGSDYSLGYTWNNDQNTYNWDSQLYVPLNQWSLAALTVTPTNATVYVLNANGIASSQHVYPHAVQTFNGTTLIGGDSLAANRTFLGTIDDVAVFNKALTRDQLSAMFYAASGATNYAPIIVTPPASQSVFTGQPATFTVIGGGSQPLTYQWQADTGTGYTNINNGGQFSGANGATLTINGATSSDAGNYQVILSNTWGTISSSSLSTASLTVNATNAPLNITLSTQQPVGMDWNATGYWNDGQGGLPASVSAAEFPGSTYELLAGSRLRTPTNPAAMFPGIQLTADGNGVWTNNPGSGSSTSEIRLKTQALPAGNGTITFPRLVMNGGQIDNGPDGTPVGYVTIGGEVDIFSNAPIYNDGAGGDNCGYNLAAWLTGTGTVEYHGDTTGSIPFNALTNNLNISNPTNTFKGAWNIVSGILLGSASGSLGTNTILIGSPTATNAALETAYNINNPKADLLLYGQMFLHQNDTFSSVFINGIPLATGTYSFATLNSTYPQYFPSSWAQQNGSSINTGSGSITVLANPAPIITSQPQPVTLYPGQEATTFSVTAVGNTPLSYQWFTNGTTALRDSGNRMGSTSNVLTIPIPTLADGGNYSLVVTNIYGAVTSSVAMLTVLPQGPPLNLTLNYGGAPVVQPVGAYWDTPTNWSDGNPASVSKYSNPGSTYEVVVGARLRTPNFTNYAAFLGGQLTVDGGGVFENSTLNNVGELRLKHSAVVGTNYFQRLIMNGGQINNSGVDSPNVDTIADVAILQGEIDILASTPIYIENTAANDRSVQIDSWLTGAGTVFWHSFGGALAGTDLRITGAANTFNGQWIVDQGALLGVGAGSLGTNNIIVGTNGLTAAVETLYDINDPNGGLVLGANGMMFLHQNDHFASVNVNGASLANGTYPFATLNNTYPANFPATWTLQNGSTIASGSGQIVVGSVAPSPAKLTHIVVSGGSLSLSATNGTAGGVWILLQSTNLALPLSQWPTNLTGNFDGSGNLSTNIVNTATNRQEFYILKEQ